MRVDEMKVFFKSEGWEVVKKSLEADKEESIYTLCNPDTTPERAQFERGRLAGLHVMDALEETVLLLMENEENLSNGNEEQRVDSRAEDGSD